MPGKPVSPPRLAAILGAALLSLTACGGSSAPPMAAQLARRFPGCHTPFTPSGGVSVLASTEQECITRTAEVFVATFSSASLERQWVIANMGGGCGDTAGNGWAAEIGVIVNETGCPVEASVAKTLGGRLVSD